jgi:hypothetical protein
MKYGIKTIVECILILSVALFFGTLRPNTRLVDGEMKEELINLPFFFLVISVELIAYWFILRNRERHSAHPTEE